MKVYHGSYVEVSFPDISHSRKRLDFGAGFYVTPLEKQAISWCKQYLRRGKQAVVNVYELDEQVFEESSFLQFDCYSEEWLDFVFLCRRGKDDSDYELISGGVANDRIFDTIELYFDGIISKADAIGRLAYEKPNFQICLRTDRVIERYLHFERSYTV